MALPVVAIVGRPNVGKSTLFNRIVGARVAIVEDTAGTTRDRIYYDTDWSGQRFTIVDTGGMETTPGSEIGRSVHLQVEQAITEADLIIFLVDARDGLSAEDFDIAGTLRETRKPVLLVANKADNESRRLDAVDFYQLGFGDVISLSALHGIGTGDLLDEVVARLPTVESVEETEGVRVAIIGRPNVGKSSLLNAMLGHERAIVSTIPGTTRDVIDTLVDYQDQRFVLLDTAGVRRAGRIEPGIEKYGVMRALRAIHRSDVVLLLVDSEEGITAQDTHLAGYARDAYRGIVLILNKWDLVLPKSNHTISDYTERVRESFKFVPYAPILFTSALTGRGVDRILGEVAAIWGQRNRRVPTSAVNTVLREAVLAHSPPSVRGRQMKLFYVTQADVNPPTFAFFVNDPKLLHFSYERYLENRLRRAFGFHGTPIKLVFRPRAEGRVEAV